MTTSLEPEVVHSVADDRIERRENLSKEEFMKEYVYRNRPVIVTDALRQWKAVGRWTPEFFKREFGDMSLALNKVAWSKDNGGADSSMASFVDRVLASTDENPAPYLRNQNLCELFPSLMQDVSPMPVYCYPNWLPESYSLKSLQRVFHEHSDIQFYFGGTGGAFPILHYDVLASHAYLFQIYGRKKFIVFSPDQTEYLYLKPRNFSEVNVEKPDFDKFPLFKKAKATTFILEPGEFLFVPSKWWHTTKMLTPCITVSLNVVNDSNWKPLTEWVCSGRKPILRLPSRLYLNAIGSRRSRRDERIRQSA
jgi:histone arginine demethylase JMJD6